MTYPREEESKCSDVSCQIFVGNKRFGRAADLISIAERIQSGR